MPIFYSLIINLSATFDETYNQLSINLVTNISKKKYLYAR